MALTVVWGSMMVFLVTGVALAGSFYGTSENDFLSAGPGDDEIYGYEGDDVIYAADGTYSSSTDTIYCGEGNDFVVIDSNDLVSSDCEVYEFDLAVY